MFLRSLLFTILLMCTASDPASAQAISSVKIEDLEKRILQARDTVLIVNFWATWCKPCVEELPGFHETVRKYAGRKVKLLLVSVDFPKDYPDGIRAFAQKNGYDSEIAWLDETDADHFCPVIDKTWSGAIPATLIIHNGNGYRKFVEGKMKTEDLETSIREALKAGA